MSTLSQPPRQPKYRHFKPRNLAVVRLDGKDHYLGKYDSKESWEKYYQLLADWKRNAGSLAPPEPDPKSGFIGISCVIEAYINFATKYYAKNDPAGKELKCITYALEPLLTLYGLTDANQFGPKSLKLVREHMIGLDWSRKLINARINLIKRCFKWAVAEELVSPTVLLGLQAVQGLRYGRSEARETEPVRPVADEHVNATLPYLGSVVAAMVRLQRITGMRVCECTIMRPCDIDQTNDVWVYEPSIHKNLWRGHVRQVPLGPKAQEILKPFMNRRSDAFLFSPAEAEAARNAERRNNRKSPMTPSQAASKPKAKPGRAKGERYDTDSHRRAIDYAVKMANKKREPDEPVIPNWYPLQLRHTRATEVRKAYGLDGAQAALGHKNADVTQVYAEKNLQVAVRIAKETG
jgi:integrase